jgi:hypothetical protein
MVSLRFYKAFQHAYSIFDLFNFVLVTDNFPFYSIHLIIFNFEHFLLFFHFISLTIPFVTGHLSLFKI